MENYKQFFENLEKLIVRNKLDKGEKNCGADDTQIESNFSISFVLIPEAYKAFLRVFGLQHAERAFGGLDFVLDSRPYDSDVAVELYPNIKRENDVLVISSNDGYEFFFIKCISENPPVFSFHENASEPEKRNDSFTSFIRECVFVAGESLRYHNEILTKYDQNSEDINMGRNITNDIYRLRKVFTDGIERHEKENGLITFDLYDQEWFNFITKDKIYLVNQEHFKKWEIPFSNIFSLEGL
ncbi:MAG TPA: SMI1/KNR4 family protein [Chitinophagales bacterium]|nr:SMI1/KNR4 family protein [Chitinophagales bacterium]